MTTAFSTTCSWRKPERTFPTFSTDGERSYLYLTTSTEQGLETAAQRYTQIPYYSDYSLAELKTELRWSPCDSPLHEPGAAYLKQTNDLISQHLWLPTDADGCVWVNPDAEPLTQEFDAVLFRLLQERDAQGTFGQGAAREAVILNILLGDQSDESRIFNASMLNGPSLLQRYQGELRECLAVWQKRTKYLSH